MTDRRDFVARVVAGLSGLAALRAAGPAEALGGRWAGASLQPLGVQLYTVRSLMADDVEGTLAAVAELGYRVVEFAGLHGRSPSGMRAVLERSGLTAVSGHYGMDRIRAEPSSVLDEASVLGLRFVTCPSLSRFDLSPEGLPRVVDDFNAFGERALGRGLGFAFHNHDVEFRPVGGRAPYDLFLEACDPASVKMQLDVYWAAHAGRDPVQLLRSHPGRFPMIHAKDRSPTGEMVDVGAGTIDFGAVLDHADEAGLTHWLVEHDHPEDPLASLAASYRTLSALGA